MVRIPGIVNREQKACSRASLASAGGTSRDVAKSTAHALRLGATRRSSCSNRWHFSKCIERSTLRTSFSAVNYPSLLQTCGTPLPSRKCDREAGRSRKPAHNISRVKVRDRCGLPVGRHCQGLAVVRLHAPPPPGAPAHPPRLGRDTVVADDGASATLERLQPPGRQPCWDWSGARIFFFISSDPLPSSRINVFFSSVIPDERHSIPMTMQVAVHPPSASATRGEHRRAAEPSACTRPGNQGGGRPFESLRTIGAEDGGRRTGIRTRSGASGRSLCIWHQKISFCADGKQAVGSTEAVFTCALAEERAGLVRIRGWRGLRTAPRRFWALAGRSLRPFLAKTRDEFPKRTAAWFNGSEGDVTPQWPAECRVC